MSYERQRKANAREQKALADEKLARLEGDIARSSVWGGSPLRTPVDPNV